MKVDLLVSFSYGRVSSMGILKLVLCSTHSHDQLFENIQALCLFFFSFIFFFFFSMKILFLKNLKRTYSLAAVTSLKARKDEATQIDAMYKAEIRKLEDRRKRAKEGALGCYSMGTKRIRANPEDQANKDKIDISDDEEDDSIADDGPNITNL
eukprot:TRINITY_DN3381_c0_g3_i1.p1 TRINITY_DN3381_c0_g3~~TRINITY_DN3381_c0_g3_i1.p1  ORF type:complete len:153 (+),score=0.79 TRINITY_DN3381_c0_g3_i1:38-496(+)